MIVYANNVPKNCNNCIFKQNRSQHLDLDDNCFLNKKRMRNIIMDKDCPLKKRSTENES